MRHTAIAFGLAGLAAASVAWTNAPRVAARPAHRVASKCSPGNHLGAAVRQIPEIWVGGKNTKGKRPVAQKPVKQGDWVTTDDQGSAIICLKQNNTSCILSSYSSVRIEPPNSGALILAGPNVRRLTCKQNDTSVQLKNDRSGHYLLINPQPERRSTLARGQLARSDPTGVDGDPVFSLRVRKGQAVTKVRQGIVLVDTAATSKQAVVAGRDQQVTAQAGQTPAQPVQIQLTPAEQKTFAQIQRQAPKDPTTPPAVTLNGPNDPSSVRNATLSFGSSQTNVTFSCALDGRDFRLCTSPVQFPRLDPGRHDFAVRATDTAGNSSLIDHPWTIDGSRIAFESFRDGNPELYTEDPDGQNQLRLTNNTISDEHPDWAPDRKRLAFDRLDGARKLDIWTINADGNGETRLTFDGADRNPSWSPDGTRIAFERGPIGDRQIVVINANGKGEKQLTSDPICELSCPIDNLDPAWSADSNQIVFASTRTGNIEIYVMNADGSNQTRLTTDPNHNAFGPSWSPNGKLIAFHSNHSNYLNIYTMNPDGSNVTRVTTSEHNDSNPSWAPDSQHLVFASDRDPNAEQQLYIVDTLSHDEPIRLLAPSKSANFAADW